MKGGEILKLDYSLQTPEERKAYVEKLLAQTPNPSNQLLENLADYLIFAMEKQERKEKKILTENRLSTVNKRETSFEGLSTQFEAGEDGVYNLITNDKNQIFRHKVSITEEDRSNIPFLRQIQQAISYWKSILPLTSNRQAYIAKCAIIELQKDQYLVKNAFLKPIHLT